MLIATILKISKTKNLLHGITFFLKEQLPLSLAQNSKVYECKTL